MEIPTLVYRFGTCALGSMIAAEWSGLPYRLCRVETADTDTPDFLRLNPLGAVPILKIGREILTESFAVLQYLALQKPDSGDRLAEITFPYGHPSFDKMNQVLAYLVSDFHKAFSPLFAGGITRDEKHKIVSGPLRKQMDYVDQYLVPRGLIFGRRTIADAYLYGTVRWAKRLYDVPVEFPNIANFQSIMDEDDGVKFAVDIEKGREAKSTGQFVEHVSLQSLVDSLEPGVTPGLQIGNTVADMAAYQARADGSAAL